MPVTLVPFNAYNPVCAVDACLSQVVGSLDNNPLGQYGSCTSLYGAPVVSTVTPSAHVVFETIYSTLSYVDITVEFTTTESMAQATSTSYDTLLETLTSYTTTRVSTVIETAAATATWNGGGGTPQKRNLRKHRRRGQCKPQSSISSSSGAVVSSTAAPSSSSPPCTDSAQHSSACSCINAVNTVSSTTLPASTTTSTVHSTLSTTSLSTSTSTVTLAITTVIVHPASTTLLTTLSTETATTTTLTSTSTSYAVSPTQTASWSVVSPASLEGRTVAISGSSPQAMHINQPSPGTNPNTNMVLTLAASQPRLASNPNLRLFLQNNSSVRNRLIFVTQGTAAASGHFPVSCSVDASSGAVACVGRASWTRMIECGGDVFMAASTYVNPGCSEVRFSVSPWF
ncbi:hypothetical protein QBC44DRAFT_384093 [Cladorrhinum sp. PSN332]|nr:hypothetical protein QBC44DRAFT_384093 [Cladorrhinum sp. PSN332]